MCFLDAKKAFDRVNHWTLAKKLLDRNVLLHTVKLFVFWYREQGFMVTALQTLLVVCHAYAGPQDIVYTTQLKQYVCWSGQSNHRIGTQQESGSEMRNLASSRSFVT